MQYSKSNNLKCDRTKQLHNDNIGFHHKSYVYVEIRAHDRIVLRVEKLKPTTYCMYSCSLQNDTRVYTTTFTMIVLHMGEHVG